MNIPIHKNECVIIIVDMTIGLVDTPPPLPEYNTYFINLTNSANEGNVGSRDMLHWEYANSNDKLQYFDHEHVEYYLSAEHADDDKPYTLCSLGRMFLYGYGVAQDCSRAVGILQKCMNMKCSQAYVEIATLRRVITFPRNSLFGVILANEKRLLHIAAKLENANGYVALADIYYQNSHLYKKYMTKAILLRYRHGYYNMGRYYHHKGKYKKAFHWYEKGCNDGSHLCLVTMGLIYTEGPHIEGYGEDTEKALILFNQAIDIGSVDAISRAAEACEKLGYMDKAKEHYQTAVALRDPTACSNLAKIFIREGDTVNAIGMYIEGARCGSFECWARLRGLGLDTNTNKDDIDEILRFIKSLEAGASTPDSW